MARKSFLIAGVALIAVAASSMASNAGPQAIPDDFVITLTRSTCFGECPAYAVTIEAKGNVTYEGKKFVRVEGRQTDRVPVARVAALAATVERIRFFELDERYRFIHTPDGGAISIDDRPTTFVVVTSAGRSKQVEDYIGAPESLKQLEKQIDETARTKRWVKLDESTFRQLIRGGWSPSEGGPSSRRARFVRTHRSLTGRLRGQRRRSQAAAQSKGGSDPTCGR